MSDGRLKKLPIALLAFLALTVLGLAPTSVPAATAPVAVQPAVDPPDVGRVSQVIGNVFVLGKDDVDWSYAEPNLIVEQGDLYQTDETGKAEIQFQNGIIFRIGGKTRVAMLETDNSKVVGIDAGQAYLRIGSSLPGNEQFLLTFPSGQVIAREPVLARVDVAEDGSSEVKVLRGSLGVESVAEGLSSLSARQAISITKGGQTQLSENRLVAADDFDRWNEERDIAFSTYQRPQYLAKDVVGEQDLNGYGKWVYVEQYNSYGWQPYVVETWRPYYYGHWYNSGRYGWTWIPEEPWGYVTYHYGSWNYAPSYGWVWIPGYTWRPSYVRWVQYDDYVGWVPLGYYGYPVVTTYPYYVTSYYPGYLDFFSFTFVFGDYFHYYDHHYYYHHDDDYDEHGHHDHHYDKDHDHEYDHDHGGDHNYDHGGDHNYDHGGDGDHHDGDHTGEFADENQHLRNDHTRLHEDHEKLRENYQTLKQNYQQFLDNRPKGPSGVANGNGQRTIASATNGSKAQFVQNLDAAKFQKALGKGEALRERPAYTQFLDTTKNPNMAKRIAEIDRNRDNGQTAASARLPQKTANDQLKKFDFRNSMRQTPNKDAATTWKTGNGNQLQNPRATDNRLNQQPTQPKTPAVQKQAPVQQAPPRQSSPQTSVNTDRSRAKAQATVQNDKIERLLGQSPNESPLAKDRRPTELADSAFGKSTEKRTGLSSQRKANDQAARQSALIEKYNQMLQQRQQVNTRTETRAAQQSPVAPQVRSQNQTAGSATSQERLSQMQQAWQSRQTNTRAESQAFSPPEVRVRQEPSPARSISPAASSIQTPAPSRRPMQEAMASQGDIAAPSRGDAVPAVRDWAPPQRQIAAPSRSESTRSFDRPNVREVRQQYRDSRPASQNSRSVDRGSAQSRSAGRSQSMPSHGSGRGRGR